MAHSAEHLPSGSAVDASVAPRWVAALVSSGFFLLMGYVLVQQVRVHLADIGLIGLASAAFLIGVLGAERLLARSVWLDRHRRPAMVIGFLIIFAVQLVFVREIYATVKWDPAAVFAAAISLSGFRESAVAHLTPSVYTVPGLSIPYWSSYPNNLLIAFLYEGMFRFCAAFGIGSPVFLSTALNVLVLDVAIILAVACANRLWDGRAARVTLLIALPVLAFSPWISIAYSDTLATVFPVLLVYLYLRYIEARPSAQFALAAAIGAVAAVGYLIKPHVVAMTLAVGIVHLASRGTPGSSVMAKVLKLTASSLVAVLIVGGFGIYRDHRLEGRISRAQMEESRFPISHFIAMSLNDDKGGYNKADVNAQRARPGVAAKNERNFQVIRERLNELGVVGYAGFLHNKLTWITTDGTFFWQGEGNLADYTPFHSGTLAQALQSVFYREGAHYRWFALAANGAWLALLFAMLAPVTTRRRCDGARTLVIMRLATVILVLMLLILEGRSRYLISFIPVFAILGAYHLSGPVLVGRWAILQPSEAQDRC